MDVDYIKRMTDLDLVRMRHALRESKGEDDLKAARLIDDELKIRHEMPKEARKQLNVEIMKGNITC